MRELACHFHLEDAGKDGMILSPEYGEELAHATLQIGEDGRLWLGLKDGRILVEPETDRAG